MAGKDLSVKIRADDQASAVFKKVGDSATTMGEAVEQAATSGGARLRTFADQVRELQQVADSNGGLQSFADQLSALDKELSTVGTGLTAAGAVGTGFFGIATNEAMQFTSAMSNVNSIARLSQGELAGMEDAILGMATAYGAMPTELAAGLYEISSSGFTAAEGLNILEASVVAAGAGMTSTDVSARAIVATLNAYKMSADEAGNVSDVLFKTVDSGVISFEQLANNMGNTLPLAASLGVTIEELGAAYADLTLSGIGASQAETQIAALMRAALGPTEALTDAVEEYGYSSAEALIQAEGLAGFLVFLDEASGGTSQGLLELVGTQEALNAALVLGQDGAQQYISTVEEMGGAVQDGAYTLEVFGIQMDNAAGSIRMAQSELAVAAINIGSALEPLVGFGAEAVSGIVGAFNALPGPLQAAITYLGAFGSVATLATGTMVLAIPKIVEFHTAMQRLGGMRGILNTLGGGFTSLLGRLNPLGLGLTALAVGGVAIWESFQEGRAAAEAYANSINDLEMSLEMLRRQGNTELADMGDAWMATVDSLDETMARFQDNLVAPTYEEYFDTRALEEYGRAFDSTNQDMVESSRQWLEDYRGVVAEADALRMEMIQHQIDTVEQTALNSILEDALASPEIDVERWLAWANSLLEGADNAEELDAAVTQIVETPLSDFLRTSAEGTEALGDAAEKATTNLESLRNVVGDIPAMLDDLRLEGRFDLASMFDGLDRELIEAFSGIDLDNITLAPWEDMIPVDLTDDQLDRLGTSVDRIMTGIESDVLDSGAVWNDFLAILSDTSLTADEQIAAIDALSTSLSQYRDHVRAMQEGQIDWLADGENILGFLDDFAVKTREGSRWFAEFGNREFRIAVDLDEANAALDSVLATFDQIDSLGQRSSSAGSIADNLIGEPGEWAAIDDLLASGRINLDQYYDALEHGTAVQESNARVQQDLNKIRADQLPLLAEEQAAYEANISALSQLGPLEQRRALALQDTAVQARLAEFYSTAYAASVGEIPEAVATEMIVSAAEADPVIRDLLEQFGLIEEGADGEIRVNFPDADATVDSINRLTIAFLEMEAAAAGMTGFQLAVEIYGEEDAMALYGMVKNADGTYSKATLAVETEGAAEAEEALRNVTLADGTVVSVKTEVDTSGWEDMTAAELAAHFENDPVQLPVEAVIEPPTGWTEDDWNSAIGPFPEIGIPVTPEVAPLEEPDWAQDGYTGGWGVPVTPEVQPLEEPDWVQDGYTGGWSVPVTGEVTEVEGDPAAIGAMIGPIPLTATVEVEPVDPTSFGPIQGPTLDGPAVEDQSMTITADDQATPVINDVVTAAGTIPESETVNVTAPGATGATSELNAVTSAAQAIPENEVVTVTTIGAGSAANALNAVASAANSIPANVSTTVSITTVRSTIDLPLPGGQTGGMVGNLAAFAGGGLVPFIGGEIGPELAYFAHGGVASLPVHGVYSAPAGTYISPNHTTAASTQQPGGLSVSVPIVINGNVIGIDNLTEEVTRQIAPALAEVARNIFREQGVSF